MPLTDAQERSLDEIRADQEKPERMLRLLQGDVGSGKTIVALLAMANVIEAGAQAAMMAPTEILARQHFSSISPLAKAAGLRIEILTGREKGKAREETLAALGRATSTSSSAHMRCSRKACSSAISASRSLTSSTASACTSGCCCPPRGSIPTCW
jgi:hypothetical protein